MRDTFIEWLILINIITFVIYALDKYKAVHHLWRIPEKTLIFLAVIGGSPAALTAMYTIRHKTRHIKFTGCTSYTCYSDNRALYSLYKIWYIYRVNMKIKEVIC